MESSLVKMTSDRSFLSKLERRTGSSWTSIFKAQSDTVQIMEKLELALAKFTTPDSSIVIVGSLARREFTYGSDVDWTLLLDGSSHPEDFVVAQDIRKTLDGLKVKQPGREGVFGSIASSHDLVHRIGGQDDTNANTTLRILLLLESAPIGRPEAYKRVIRNVLRRYLDEDRGLWVGSGNYKVPRFLFNDVARYWRTMTVDFAYKQRSRRNEGFAIRNLKLRMSRKLLFLAGMIACFECHLSFISDEERKTFFAPRQVQAVIDLMTRVLSNTPMEILASALLRYPELDEQSKKLFDAYNKFLGMLADEEQIYDGKTIRQHLDDLPSEKLETDPVAARGREISHRFRDAIEAIFLTDTNELGKMTIEYGVF